MRFSQLITKTTKEAKQADPSRNAELLTRAGYIDKLMAGVYSYLPLGLRVLSKIENIIREEMNNIGASEVLMPAIQPREIWEQTGRWDKVDVLYKLKGAGDQDLALGATHEEVVTPLITQYVQSYRDLPKATYQIQTKFRNELRAKSGLLRGREFRMKDMYSFHADDADQDRFYQKSIQAYKNIYDRCGIGNITYVTYASGGIFSKYSHEFQTITEYGEDTIYQIPDTNIAINKEIIDDIEVLKELMPNYQNGDEEKLVPIKAIEVGNIFKLGTKFADAFDKQYQDQNGELKNIHMGCYGIGPSRVMGTIAECLSDDKGLIWPEEIAPYKVHLISLTKNADEIKEIDTIYEMLKDKGIEVLYDDRTKISAGQKFSDADLIGIPHRVVISSKTLAERSVEYKKRTDDQSKLIPLDDLKKIFVEDPKS